MPTAFKPSPRKPLGCARSSASRPANGQPSFLTLLWFLRCRTCVCAQACNHGCDGGRDDSRCQQRAEANPATSMARADMTSPTVSAARAQVPATAKLSAAKTIKTTYHHGHRDG